MNTNRIMIVDDKEENLYLLCALLKSNGYEVITAKNGTEALDLARQNPPDLIVTDILMPVMDGFALCREWKKDKSLKRIPFIFYTATYTDERDRQFALSLGAERFIIKPEEPDVIMAIVRETILQGGSSTAAHVSYDEIQPLIKAPEEEDVGYLKQYNEALVGKLENKMEQLENANRELEQDIAVREKVEEDLMFRNAILLTQQEASLDGILIVDENGVIISFNRRFVDMWDIPSEVIESRSDDRALQWVLSKLIDPDEFSNKVKVLYENRHETSRDEISLNDGRMFDRYTTPMIGANDKYYGRAWYFRDISERNRLEKEKGKLEAQLQHAQKLEAIGQIASGVAHDFNNCLGGISGYAEMLQLKLIDKSPELAQYAETIVSLSMKASRLTRQLLTFARKSKLDMLPLDVHDSVREVVSILSHTINRLIKLGTCLKAEHSVVCADRSQIENAIMNLCVNACDAMPEGGILTISTCNCSVTPQCLAEIQFGIALGDYVEISVADTGTGMSEETMKHIFEPFYTTKEPGKGTGLGLPSVYGTARQHNGYVDVRSEPGKGTKFLILLPLLKDQQVSTSTEQRPMIYGNGRILVIDDEESIRESESKMLSAMGYTVVALEDGKKGAAYYEKHWKEIDLVIVDMIMPEMNGLECFRRLKKTNPAVRVIVASGCGETSEGKLMKAEGADGFLDKPFRMIEIAQVVSSVLAKTTKG